MSISKFANRLSSLGLNVGVQDKGLEVKLEDDGLPEQ